ncbi:hypothetical protein TcWFU_010300 [Taenia crassiceps]|uniref:Uncharacterized protein n=1 Tax=Taenia crassiceps TaxID=6207 RepID=A0ABR4QJ35_9CEST
MVWDAFRQNTDLMWKDTLELRAMRSYRRPRCRLIRCLPADTVTLVNRRIDFLSAAALVKKNAPMFLI